MNICSATQLLNKVRISSKADGSSLTIGARRNIAPWGKVLDTQNTKERYHSISLSFLFGIL